MSVIIKPRARIPEVERSPGLRWYYRNHDRELEKANERSRVAYKKRRETSAAFFRANPERYAKYQRQRRAVVREAIRWYKLLHPCLDCGETDPIVLDFDHVRGEKKFNLGAVGNLNPTVQTAWNEIQKCEVVCANCHRKRSARRRNG